MLDFDPQRVWLNARKATSEDLLNRVTVYRQGMEPEAISIIEKELAERGIDQADIDDYAARKAGEVIMGEDGVAARCSFCHEPAVAAGWGWHRLFGKLPLFPRYFYYCSEHRPAQKDAAAP